MQRRERVARAAERRGDLHEAAGVGARVRIWLGGEDVRRLALAELARRFRLREVVDPRRAAADRLLRGFQALEAGDRVEQIARLDADALRVGQMARVLERDAQSSG